MNKICKGWKTIMPLTVYIGSAKDLISQKMNNDNNLQGLI